MIAKILDVPIVKKVLYEVTLPGADMDSEVGVIQAYAKEQLKMSFTDLNQGSDSISRRKGGIAYNLLLRSHSDPVLLVSEENRTFWQDSKVMCASIVLWQIFHATLKDDRIEKHANVYYPLPSRFFSQQQLTLLDLEFEPIGILIDNDPTIGVKFVEQDDVAFENKCALLSSNQTMILTLNDAKHVCCDMILYFGMLQRSGHALQFAVPGRQICAHDARARMPRIARTRPRNTRAPKEVAPGRRLCRPPYCEQCRSNLQLLQASVIDRTCHCRPCGGQTSTSGVAASSPSMTTPTKSITSYTTTATRSTTT